MGRERCNRNLQVAPVSMGQARERNLRVAATARSCVISFSFLVIVGQQNVCQGQQAVEFSLLTLATGRP